MISISLLELLCTDSKCCAVIISARDIRNNIGKANENNRATMYTRFTENACTFLDKTQLDIHLRNGIGRSCNVSLKRKAYSISIVLRMA